LKKSYRYIFRVEFAELIIKTNVINNSLILLINIHSYKTNVCISTGPFLHLQDLIFVRLQSKVQTAQFKMRSRGLMLDEDMHRALLELPGDYDVATYFLFLKTYGTHYVTEGTVGGVLEYVVVLNKTAMASSSTKELSLI